MKDSAYFVAMPKIPPIHVQKTAPAPPIVMAVPTPMMFPVPIVEESAVIREPKTERSPLSEESLRKEMPIPLNTSFCTKPVLYVR